MAADRCDLLLWARCRCWRSAPSPRTARAARSGCVAGDGVEPTPVCSSSPALKRRNPLQLRLGARNPASRRGVRKHKTFLAGDALHVLEEFPGVGRVVRHQATEATPCAARSCSRARCGRSPPGRRAVVANEHHDQPPSVATEARLWRLPSTPSKGSRRLHAKNPSMKDTRPRSALLRGRRAARRRPVACRRTRRTMQCTCCAYAPVAITLFNGRGGEHAARVAAHRAPAHQRRRAGHHAIERESPCVCARAGRILRRRWTLRCGKRSAGRGRDQAGTAAASVRGPGASARGAPCSLAKNRIAACEQCGRTGTAVHPMVNAAGTRER